MTSRERVEAALNTIRAGGACTSTGKRFGGC